MIQITPHIRIFLCVNPVDFRKGIDGFARVCKSVIKEDPFSGSMFVFTNKRRKALRILCYDGQGYWLFQKRLSEGKFKWWPKPSSERSMRLESQELYNLIWNGNPEKMVVGPMWRKIA